MLTLEPNDDLLSKIQTTTHHSTSKKRTKTADITRKESYKL